MMDLGSKSSLVIIVQTIALLSIAILAISKDYILEVLKRFKAKSGAQNTSLKF
tara:strand:+ start:553 stop:711 length:159 start_codon:yes stop_codon:yes gene_type:complete